MKLIIFIISRGNVSFTIGLTDFISAFIDSISVFKSLLSHFVAYFNERDF